MVPASGREDEVEVPRREARLMTQPQVGWCQKIDRSADASRGRHAPCLPLTKQPDKAVRVTGRQNGCSGLYRITFSAVSKHMRGVPIPISMDRHAERACLF
jgi:hypothetical protein